MYEVRSSQLLKNVNKIFQILYISFKMQCEKSIVRLRIIYYFRAKVRTVYKPVFQ
jgi:hypothetical protein